MKAALRAVGALWLGLTVALGCVAPSAVGAAEAPIRLAKGLIVKLKRADHRADSTASVVRLQAAAVSGETVQSVRMRLAAVARRQGVGYLVHRPTAFSAQLIHSGHIESFEQAQAQAERLRADPDVEWVIVNELARPASVIVGDPAYPQQTWLHERETNFGGRKGVANIAAAWDAMQGKSLSPVVVAVLDTGILPAPDLNGRIAQGYDFVSEVDYSGDGDGVDADPSDPGISLSKIPASLRDGCSVAPVQWHGLRIAAMLGAATGNALNGAGILAPVSGQVVLPVRVGGMCGAELSDIIEGMLWAAGVDYQGSPARNLHPARVINLSFGGDGACSDTGTHDAAWLYRDTIKTLESKGALVVASAGNGDPDTGLGLASPTRPASCQGVLAVTALNQRGFKANYANLINSTRQSGLAVAGGDMVVSEGTDHAKQYTLVDDGIVTLANTGDQAPSPYYEMQTVVGTSFAAPTASGVAALMLALDPSLTVAELRQALVAQIEPFPTEFSPALPACRSGEPGQGNCACTALTCGAGVLDALRAVNWAMDHAALLGGSLPGVSSVASSDSSCFKPDRVGGGTSCGSGAGSAGGGGGATDAWSLAALGVVCLVSLWMRRRAHVAWGIKGVQVIKADRG